MAGEGHPEISNAPALAAMNNQSGTAAQPKAPPHPPVEEASMVEHPEPKNPRVLFFLDWFLKVLGVAAALLFGIWAPLSYKATADGNNGNDASQEKMSIQASRAAVMQSSAAAALADLQERLDDMGTLRVWEFCEGRERQIDACDPGILGSKINSVVSRLAGLPSTTSPTLRPTPTRTPGASTSLVTTTKTTSTPDTSVTATPIPPDPMPKASGRISKNLLHIALGAVLPAVIIISFIGACILRKKKKAR